jgi:predicted dehydrogenase
VTLRFPKNRLAQFNLSYFGNPSNSLIVVGTEGTLELDPAYTFGKALAQTITIGEKKKEQSFKNTDHFGGEMKYFSDCILNNESPEPDGEEGFADVRVLEGIMEALDSGRAITLPPFERPRRIDTERQKVTLGAVSTPELVHAGNPGRDAQKKPKN